MNFRLKIAAFALLAIFAVSCNSNKKKVETEGGKLDLSKYSRVGNVDTSQEKEVLPGNVKSIDEYVATIRKSPRMDLKNFTGDPKFKSIAFGGKIDVHQLTNVVFSNYEINSINLCYKNDKIIYAETRANGKNGPELMKYYFENDRITTTMQGSVQSSDPNTRGTLELKVVENKPGMDAMILGLEKEINAKFLNSSPFKSKVYVDGQGYKAVTCYTGKELKVVDPNGFITRLFKENNVGTESKFMFVSIEGSINEKDGKINVTGATFQGKDLGNSGCF